MENLWNGLKLFLVLLIQFKRRGRVKRYGLVVILVGLVFLLKVSYQSILGGDSAFLFISFVVALSSWYGGFGPGIFATVLSDILVYFLFLSHDTTHPVVWGDMIVLSIFFLEGFLMSIVSEARFELEGQKNDFIGFAAHELKNPLSAIKGFAELIHANATISENGKIISYSQSINAQTDKILEFVNDLLDLTKIEVGKFSYSYINISAKDIVKEAITHQQLVNSRHTIVFRGSSHQHLLVDKYRIGQVVTNLLTNAIKYSPEDTKVVVGLKDNKRTIVVSVKDQGEGIEEKEQEKIFEKFYRVGRMKKNNADGMGVGLYICQQIIRHHNGKIWVKSEKGKGSTFFVELPAAKKNITV